MFDSLFIVMNEKNEILGWRLDKGASFDKVKGLLEGRKVWLTESYQEFCVVTTAALSGKSYKEYFENTFI